MKKMLRIVITLLAAVGGLMITDKLIQHLASLLSEDFLRIGIFGITMTTIMSFVFGGIVCGVAGFMGAPMLIKYILRMTAWIETRLGKMPVNDMIAGACGLTIGLIIANLLGAAFLPIPIIGSYVPLLLNVVLGYAGVNITIKKREEIIALVSNLAKFAKEKGKTESHKEDRHQYKVLDTSVIIDGRIADICQAGFLEGTLVIPVFVLEELQHIADSSDLLKRNRGRRGLDILNRIQKEQDVHVQINNQDFEDISEVDSKLVKLCQVLGAKIVTNDYNLNKVAELQGVAVLNINELSNAVKPVVIPGEEMITMVVKDGKEHGQGVAYLDDGTMIVIENGRKHMGDTITVLVTSVLQTAAGRMIFAKPK